MNPRWERIVAYLLACIAFALSIFAYEELRLIGFPDGFLADWDQARKILLSLSIGISLLGGSWFVLLGRITAQKRIGTKLGVTGVLYAISMTILFVADFYLHQRSGRGG